MITLELNRTTFRRLVQLQIVIFIGSFLVVTSELVTDPFASFDEAFQSLVAEHFGSISLDSSPTSAGYLVLGGIVIWMAASSIGLLWFKTWARFGIWASLVAVVPVLLAIEGYRPSYTSPLADWLSMIDAGLVGAILLLAYSRDHGAVWFARDTINMERS